MPSLMPRSNKLTALQATKNFQNLPNVKSTIIQLLSNLATSKEVNQYIERFSHAGKNQFAVIKVGGSIIENEIDDLCASLSFLTQIGLFPIVVHGGGPQLSNALDAKKIAARFVEGQRVTTEAVLQIAKQSFKQQNQKICKALESTGTKSASLTNGIFNAVKTENTKLGLVGDVTGINLEPINNAINTGAIPIISPLGKSSSGQLLNINADVAANQLAIKLKPFKIIFLSSPGGILDQEEKIISSINLITEYDKLMSQKFLFGGMKLKLIQAAEILSQLPSSSSVSITTPKNLAKELFTYKGSGTLIKKGVSIMTHFSNETIKQKKLLSLIENGFKKNVIGNYMDSIVIYRAYITYCYRAAAIITRPFSISFLDKFVVAEDAKGEGLGKVLWKKIKHHHKSLFWRCRVDNPINKFYFKNSDGCIKTLNWHVFWYGLDDFSTIQQCVEYALDKEPALS